MSHVELVGSDLSLVTCPTSRCPLGVNIQALTDQTGRALWSSASAFGRTYALTAARDHGIVAICRELGIAVPADKAHAGGDTGRWRHPSRTAGTRTPLKAH